MCALKHLENSEESVAVCHKQFKMA